MAYSYHLKPSGKARRAEKILPVVPTSCTGDEAEPDPESQWKAESREVWAFRRLSGTGWLFGQLPVVGTTG